MGGAFMARGKYKNLKTKKPFTAAEIYDGALLRIDGQVSKDDKCHREQ